MYNLCRKPKLLALCERSVVVHGLKLVPATLIAAATVTTGAAGATGSHASSAAENGRIAFTRYFGPRYDDKTRSALFTVARSGRGERRLTHPGSEASDFEPDWSPDGSQVAFTRSGRFGPATYTVRSDGSGLARVSRPCRRAKPRRCDQDITPAFSPDGRDVTFASSDGRLPTGIVIVGSDGRNRRVVVPATWTVEGVDPRFSPDGNRIVFERHNLGRKQPKDGRAVFLVNVDGSGLSRVTPWSLDAGDPDWSPDGKWILFGSNEELKKPSQLYLIHPDGTGLDQLTRVRRGTLRASASFSPDGKWIVFAASGVGGKADLYTMRANGTDVRRLTRTRLWDSAPDWGSAR
jgi:Tol biopolymer transport system component